MSIYYYLGEKLAASGRHQRWQRLSSQKDVAAKNRLLHEAAGNQQSPFHYGQKIRKGIINAGTQASAKKE